MMPVWRKFASVSMLVAGWLFVALLTSANAHEVRPVIVDFKADKTGNFELSLNLNLESWLARIGPEHSDTADSPNAVEYNRLRKLDGAKILVLLNDRIADFADSMKLRFGKTNAAVYAPNYLDAQIPEIGDIDLARDSIVRFRGIVPAGATSVSWLYNPGPSVFRVEGLNQKKAALYVAASEVSEAVAIEAPVGLSGWASFLDYVGVGFDHIIPKGLDHILFVVGLFLLSTRLRPLLWQITSFTVAHTVTLGLGMAGVISIPANIVEPLIAASIVYVAVENIFMDRLSPWRPVVVFFFGLLHGLGFAGVLKEFGLGAGNFVAGLIGFNVGVELGQLAVIAVCFLAVGFWFGRKDWYHARVTIPGSVIIALIGSWWFYERVFLA